MGSPLCGSPAGCISAQAGLHASPCPMKIHHPMLAYTKALLYFYVQYLRGKYMHALKGCRHGQGGGRLAWSAGVLPQAGVAHRKRMMNILSSLPARRTLCSTNF